MVLRKHAATTCVVWLALLACLSAIALGRPDGREEAVVCYIYFPSGSATTSVWHAHFALTQYHHIRNDIVDFKLKVVHKDQNPDPTIAVRAMIENEEHCDMFLGPVASSYATPTAPIASVPVISESATSTALSNKAVYEYFSRTTMTDHDSGKALAATMNFMGITEISILCLEDSFGLSLAEAVRTSFSSYNGTVGVDLCWPHTVSKASMMETLSLIKSQARSTALVLSMSPKDGFLDLFEEALTESGVAGEFTFFVSDMICNDLQGRTAFGGSFCTLQGLNQTAASKYQAAWTAYNKSDLAFYSTPKAQDGEGLLPYRDAELFNAYSGLVVDAVHLSMEVIRNAVKQDPQLLKRPDRGRTLLDAVRRTTIFGTSGQVTLDPSSGDRVVGMMELFNVPPTNDVTSIGMYEPSASRLDWVKDQEWYIAGHGYRNKATLPSFARSLEEPESQNLDYSLLIIAGLAIILMDIFLIGQATVTLRNSERGAFSKLAKNRSVWLVIGSISAYIADISSDVAGLYVVVSRDSPLAFAILYGILTVSAFTVSSIEVFKLVKLFRLHLRYAEKDGGVPAHLLVYWENAIAHYAVLSLIVEDIPMVALASAAVIQEKSSILMISLTISSIAAGFKFGKVGVVMRALMQPDFTANLEMDNIEFTSETTNTNSLESSTRSLTAVAVGPSNVPGKRRGSRRQSGFTAIVSPSVEVFHDSPEFLKEQLRNLMESKRLEVLQRAGVDLSFKLSDLDLLEFFAIAKPILNQYEGYRPDELESAKPPPDAHCEPQTVQVKPKETSTDSMVSE